jgi:uncharacterized protein YdhG (YjbR/CyaY superfamily)
MKGPATKYTNVDEYIAGFPAETKAKLSELRAFIRKQLPGEVTQEISYGIPVFKLKGKYVIYFAGYKNHLGIYPVPPGDKAFQKLIAPYVKGKGTMHFALDKPLPLDVIEKVVAESISSHAKRLLK